MSGPFFDTGVALKLVVREPLSATARAYVAKRGVSVPFTRLIELEMETALQALCFRGEITGPQLAAARALIAEMVKEGKFRRVDLSLDQIASESLSLSPLITAKTGCRTLDLMHVCTAKLLCASEFVSTDKRQLKAARFAGLRAVDLSAT
jgi:predicted nucleic acid-binding protein